jgi:hypothetical protein
MAMLKDRINKLKHVLKHTGIKGMLRVALNGAIVRPAKSKIGWILFNKRYPQHLIFVAGFAKGGTSWFAHMLSSLPGFNERIPAKWPLGSDVKHSQDVYAGMVSEFAGGLTVSKGHTWGTRENAEQLKAQRSGKYVIVVRDPRDVLISAYWYIRRIPAHWDYQKASTLDLPDYLQDKLVSGDFKVQFIDWLDEWMINRDPDYSTIVRYEDLLSDTVVEMRRVFDFLGFNLSDSQIQAIVEKNSFERKAKRKRGQENTKLFLRKGVSGEWREVFSEQQKQLAEEQCGDTLKQLGYAQ